MNPRRQKILQAMDYELAEHDGDEFEDACLSKVLDAVLDIAMAAYLQVPSIDH